MKNTRDTRPIVTPDNPSWPIPRVRHSAYTEPDAELKARAQRKLSHTRKQMAKLEAAMAKTSVDSVLLAHKRALSKLESTADALASQIGDLESQS